MKKRINRPSLLVFIRHAESVRNEAKKGSIYFADDESRRGIEGTPDHLIPLTENGLRQAALTGPELRRRFGTPAYLYHSGYTRAVQTADGILNAYTARERTRIEVRQHIFIRERDPGYAYDMTGEEVAANFPFMDKYWKTFGGFFARPVGGESLAQMTERAYMFLNMLFRDRAGQKVFVVTHGGTLRCFRFLLERWNYEQALRWAPGESPKNCGLTVYKYDKTQGRLILQEHNTVCW